MEEWSSNPITARSRRCSAKAKGTGEQCRNPAVTTYSVCRNHGARGGRPITHGRRSKHREVYEAFEAYLERRRALLAQYQSGRMNQIDKALGIDPVSVALESADVTSSATTSVRNLMSAHRHFPPPMKVVLQLRTLAAMVGDVSREHE